MSTDPTARPADQGQAPQQSEIVLIEKDANTAYSNFARVTATAEEVIIDFCLNPNPFFQGRQEINVSQRLIMNFYTAKRLYAALAMTLQRHEQTFGSIELDVRRRAHSMPGSGALQPPPAPGPR
jgi:ribosomal protein L31